MFAYCSVPSVAVRESDNEPGRSRAVATIVGSVGDVPRTAARSRGLWPHPGAPRRPAPSGPGGLGVVAIRPWPDQTSVTSRPCAVNVHMMEMAAKMKRIAQTGYQGSHAKSTSVATKAMTTPTVRAQTARPEEPKPGQQQQDPDSEVGPPPGRRVEAEYVLSGNDIEVLVNQGHESDDDPPAFEHDHNERREHGPAYGGTARSRCSIERSSYSAHARLDCVSNVFIPMCRVPMPRFCTP
jgi:hypothetical protein